MAISAEHRSKFAALHLQMSEKILNGGQETPNKETKIHQRGYYAPLQHVSVSLLSVFCINNCISCNQLSYKYSTRQ